MIRYSELKVPVLSDNSLKLSLGLKQKHVIRRSRRIADTMSWSCHCLDYYQRDKFFNKIEVFKFLIVNHVVN